MMISMVEPFLHLSSNILYMYEIYELIYDIRISCFHCKLMNLTVFLRQLFVLFLLLFFRSVIEFCFYN